jgi:hypothetical protein
MSVVVLSLRVIIASLSSARKRLGTSGGGKLGQTTTPSS